MFIVATPGERVGLLGDSRIRRAGELEDAQVPPDVLRHPGLEHLGARREFVELGLESIEEARDLDRVLALRHSARLSRSSHAAGLGCGKRLAASVGT